MSLRRFAFLWRATVCATLPTTLLLTPESAAAQAAPAAATSAATGRIAGKVIDAATGAGLTDAGIQIVGTTVGTMSGVDGRFTIARVPSGTVTITVRRIGYQAKTITGLMLPAGGAIEQNITMNVASVQLTTQTVTASAERGSVSDALARQKKSSNVLNEITSEQISRSPDNDAAAAVQRVSGVSVQDGKYVFVRGLGERYTTASLNGSRLPSPEPERKVVPLDLFPSGLLQSVTTIKTFTPDIQGDFSGAQVDIKTKEFPARRQVIYQFSLGANTLGTGREIFSAPRAGGELFGLGSNTRNPSGVLSSTNFLSNVTQQRFNEITRSQRNVWTPNTGTGLPNSSMAVSAGGNRILGKGIGYIVSANYGLSQEVRADEEFAVGNAGPNNTVAPLQQFRGSTGRTSALWGGLANFSTMLGRKSRISLNNTVTRSADNEARQDQGFDENLADSVRRTTLRYVERGVVSSQLAGEHQLTANQRTDWSLTLARTSRREPDRSDVVYARDPRGTFRLLGSLDGARRLYFDLGEDNNVAQINHQLWIGGVDKGVMVKLGGYYRATDRDANAPIFSFLSRQGDAFTSRPADQLFGADAACDACTNVNVQPIGQAGSYTATDRTSAGYLMSEFGLFGSSRLIVGARVEDARITVNTTTQGGFTNTARLTNTDVLPSLVLNTKLGERTNLRFAATQTLARPEYRELSPVTFRDVLGGVSLTGNDQLVRTLIQNYDARWEFFPTPAEVVSISLFGKRFDRPIERVEVATSGSAQARFQNARSAVNYGIELELRKQLGFLGTWGDAFTAFTNTTIMQSDITLDVTGTASVTNEARRMVGQAPYVVNTGLTYASLSGGTSATLLYNVVGPRITAAGALPLPDIIDKQRHVVDLSLRVPLITDRLSVRADARNLLDARYRIMQGNLVREGFNAGRVISVGMQWKQ
jgi:hypothetical protein